MCWPVSDRHLRSGHYLRRCRILILCARSYSFTSNLSDCSRWWKSVNAKAQISAHIIKRKLHTGHFVERSKPWLRGQNRWKTFCTWVKCLPRKTFKKRFSNTLMKELIRTNPADYRMCRHRTPYVPGIPHTGGSVEKSPFQISANRLEFDENVNRTHWLVAKWTTA